MLDVSCRILPRRRAGFVCLAAFGGLNDDHGTAAFRARLMDIRISGIVDPVLVLHLFGFWHRIKQTPDHADPVPADLIGKEACVADAVEAGG